MPLAEHDKPKGFDRLDDFVSIHVPLAEHDSDVRGVVAQAWVSIHVPLAEHDRPTGIFTTNC